MATNDVVVVGGGIIGCTLAWRLAGEGARVTLLERGQPGTEASWAAAGLLEPTAGSYGGAPLLAHWLSGLDGYPAFVAALQEETGLPFEYRITGRLLLALDQSDLPARHAHLRVQQEAGIPCEFWSAERVRSEEPNVPATTVGALYFPNHGMVDPRGLMAALAVAATRRGVTVVTDTEVTGLVHEGERVVGVVGGKERWNAGATVIAAGSWSGGFGPLHVPVVPSKGQIVAFKMATPVCHHILSLPGVGLSPRADGRLVFGATHEDMGFDKRVTAGGIAHLLTGAIRLCPAIADLPVHETWAGLRPLVPSDRLPVLGSAVLGLYYATGHGGMGILSAPATAEALTGLILTGTSPLPIEEFSPLRFGAGAGDR